MSSRKLVLKQKLSFVNVEAIRSSDFGRTNDIVDVETHLGSTIKINGNILGKIIKDYICVQIL